MAIVSIEREVRYKREKDIVSLSQVALRRQYLQHSTARERARSYVAVRASESADDELLSTSTSRS